MRTSDKELLLCYLNSYEFTEIGTGYYETIEKGLEGNEHPTYMVEGIPVASTILMTGGNTIATQNDLISVAELCFKYLNEYCQKKYTIKKGLTWAKTYKKIPMNCFFDKLVKNIYRILKTIRNATIHEQTIELKENSVFIDYDFHTHYHLDISYNMLSNIFRVISGIYKGSIEGRNSAYYLGVLTWYYISIQPGNELSLSDDFRELKRDNKLDNLDKKEIKYFDEVLVIEPIREHIYKNVAYEVQESKIRILTKKKHLEKTDYSITYNNKDYIIPEEALNEQNQLELDELERWCVSN